MPHRSSRLLTGALALGLLAGCATVPGSDRLAQRDPLEGFNRAMWGLDRGLDRVILKPITIVYRGITPSPLRQGIANFFSNLTEPWSFINALLQGKPSRAGRALKRFVVNTTVGIGGVFDPATKAGLKQQREDLGQTFATWGMNAGPYLVLPFFGPTTLRDGVGSGVGAVADPYNVCIRECGLSRIAKIGVAATSLVSSRAQLTDSGADKLLDSSADSYATARSAYLQRRRALIADNDDNTDDGTVDAADFETTGDTAPTTTTGAANPAGATPPTPPAPATTPAATPDGDIPPATTQAPDAPPAVAPAQPAPAP